EALIDLQKNLEKGYLEASKAILRQPLETRFASEVVDEPPWLAVAWEQMVGGLSDTPHIKTSEQIKAYFASVGVGDSEGMPWAAAFVAHCVKSCGIPSLASTISQDAVSSQFWREWGYEAPRPPPIGSIVVIRPMSPSFVGILVAFDGEKVKLLGGIEGSANTP